MQRISGHQAMLLTYIYPLVIILASPSALMMETAGQDAWMAVPIAAAVAAVGLWLLSRTAMRCPDQDVPSTLVRQHPVMGRVVTLLFAGFFFLTLTRDLRITVDFVNLTLLQRTPLLVQGGLMALSAAMVARSGLETAGRTAEVFAPVVIAVIIILPILVLNSAEWRHLQPVLEDGFGRVFGAAWIAAPHLGEVIVIPLVCASGLYRVRQAMYGLLMSAAQFTLLMVTSLLVLGSTLGHRLFLPHYETVREIRITDFMDRWDLTIVAVYLPSLLIKLGVSLYAVCLLVSLTVPNVRAQRLAFPMATLALTACFWIFGNAAQTVELHRTWSIIGLTFEIGLPLLLFVFFWPGRATKGREKGTSARMG